MDTGIAKTLVRIADAADVDVRVHFSRNPFQKDPIARALEIFNAERMTESRHRNSVLVFLNLRTKGFALLADDGIHKKLKQKYWDELAAQFREDLQSTHHENAVVVLLYTLLERLKKLYPTMRRS